MEEGLPSSVIRRLDALGTFDHPAIAFLFVQEDRSSAIKHATFPSLYSLIFTLICQIYKREPGESAAFWPIVSRKEAVKFNSFYRQWCRSVKKYLPEGLNSLLEYWPTISSVKGCFEALERLSLLAILNRLAKEHHTVGAFSLACSSQTDWESLTAQEVCERERTGVRLEKLISEQILAKQRVENEKERLQLSIKEKQEQLRKLTGCNECDSNEEMTLKAQTLIQVYRERCEEFYRVLSPLEALDQRLDQCLAATEYMDGKEALPEDKQAEIFSKVTLQDGSIDVSRLCEELKLKLASMNVANNGDDFKRVFEQLPICERLLQLQGEDLAAIKDSLTKREESLRLAERPPEKEKAETVPPNSAEQMLYWPSAERDSAES